MEFLTATEIASIWEITPRMITNYCESGRIKGAIKKGRFWLIPSTAEKPEDKRYSKGNVNIEKKNKFEKYDEQVKTYMMESYTSSDVYKNLGLTRDTIRYYEKLGLLKLKRNEYSSYRIFDYEDIALLMAIDFFRKRGFTAIEIGAIMKLTQIDEYSFALDKKANELSEEIKKLQYTLTKLQKTKEFYNEFSNHINEFTVEYLPRYFVKETLFAFANFGEYEEKIIKSIDLKGDDIYSSMIRTVTFDENGFIASKMFLIDKEQGDIDGVYLESGKCLHTVLYTDDHDELIMNKLLDACKKWAKENDAEFRGLLYIFIKFVVPNAKSSMFYYDVWLPLR